MRTDMTSPQTASVSTAPRAFGRTELRRIAMLAIGAPLVVSIIGTALALSWLHELPDPVAVHWGVTGKPDGFGSVALIIALFPALGTTFGIALTLGLSRMNAVGVSSWTPRALVATSVWLSVFLTSVGVGSLAIQRGLETAAEAGSILPVLGVGFAASLLPAVGAYALAPWPRVVEQTEITRSALELGADERIYWSRAVNPAPVFRIVLVAISVIAVGACVTVLLVGTGTNVLLSLAPLVILALVAATGFWRVTIDNAGLRVRNSLGLKNFTYPLSDITTADAISVSPFGEFGGWGLRWGGNGRFGIIISGGSALEITRTDGQRVVVTVDDARTAAALLNGLISRTNTAA